MIPENPPRARGPDGAHPSGVLAWKAGSLVIVEARTSPLASAAGEASRCGVGGGATALLSSRAASADETFIKVDQKGIAAMPPYSAPIQGIEVAEVRAQGASGLFAEQYGHRRGRAHRGLCAPASVADGGQRAVQRLDQVAVGGAAVLARGLQGRCHGAHARTSRRGARGPPAVPPSRSGAGACPTGRTNDEVM